MPPCSRLKDPRDTVSEHRPTVLNRTTANIGHGASGSQTLTRARLLSEWLHLKQTALLTQKACPEREKGNSDS